jgi:hypothetical protein
MQGTGVWSAFKLKRDEKEAEPPTGKGADQSGANAPRSPPRG